MSSTRKRATVVGNNSESNPEVAPVRKSRASSASRKADVEPKKPRSRSRKAAESDNEEEEEEEQSKVAPKKKSTTKKTADAAAAPARRRSTSRTPKVVASDEEEEEEEEEKPKKRRASKARKVDTESESEQEDAPAVTKSPVKRQNRKSLAPPTPILTTTDALLTAHKSHKLIRRQPVDTPPFTLQDLRNEVKDLFEKPLEKTIYFIVRDLFLVSMWFFLNLFILYGALYLTTTLGQKFGWDLSVIRTIRWMHYDRDHPAFSWATFITQSPNALLTAPWCQIFKNPAAATYTLSLAAMSWNYIYWQGHFFTGLLIIGHEAHHHHFGASFHLPGYGQIHPFHLVGWVFHSFLFIPYFSWGFSHRNHHTFNKNQAHDEAHVMAHVDDVFPSVSRAFGPDLHRDCAPKPRTTKFFHSFKALCGEIHDNLTEFSFLYRVLYMVLYATIGFPLYLIMNASNRQYPNNGSWLPPNHFDPNSLVFHKGEGPWVIISNIGLLLNCAWIYFAYQWTKSLPFIALYYFIPYVHCHFYFVVYTLCHHSSPSLPTYSGEKWNYLQGAMSTIDRTHGALIDNLWHYISRTHVIHHIFSDLPFYHSWEATERLKPILGDYYMFTDEDDRWFGSLIALWNHVRDGTFIAEDNHAGLALVAAAHKASKTQKIDLDHPLVEQAVIAALPQALANDPHKDGRNVEAEVFWQRSLQIDYEEMA